jgi:DNA-binding NtrC family response regulator
MEPLESSEREAEVRREVVLIVEDDFMVRWPTAEYLRDSGYRVIEAGSAREAMVVFSSGTHIDVVFSDVNLSSGPTGYEFARWLGDSHPAVPVLLTSGDAPSSNTPAVVPFIPKPYVLAEVEQRIEDLIAHRHARAV